MKKLRAKNFPSFSQSADYRNVASKFENKIKNQNPIDMCKIERGAPQPVAA